jgi:Arc/MetJ-type ribon-helix-helix transcriptional regulator
MTITLNPAQEPAIRDAIQAGVVQSMDEFIDIAIEALPRQERVFDKEKARAAVERIRELRKGVRLNLEGMSFREFAHLGHNIDASIRAGCLGLHALVLRG